MSLCYTNKVSVRLCSSCSTFSHPQHRLLTEFIINGKESGSTAKDGVRSSPPGSCPSQLPVLSMMNVTGGQGDEWGLISANL